MRYLLILVFVGLSLTSTSQKADTARKEFIAVLTLAEQYKDDKNWTPAVMEIAGAHFQRLVKFKNDGVVVMAGRTEYESNNPDMMGVVIFTATDAEAARKFMMEDPAVKNKIMLVKIHPFVIAVK